MALHRGALAFRDRGGRSTCETRPGGANVAAMRVAKTTLTALLVLGASVAALRLLGSSGAAEQASPEAAPPALLGPRADDAPPPTTALPSPPPQATIWPRPTPTAHAGPLRRAPATRRKGDVAVTVSSPDKQGKVWIDPYEITVSQFKACVDAGACRMEEVTVQADSPCNYDAPDRGDHPMNCVSWRGADAYCRFRGERLCKEEEWFAGCRGPEQRDYPYGTTYVENACNAIPREGVDVATQRTAPVGGAEGCEGGYPGLWDMVGNVSEWVDSCDGDYCHFYGGAFLENDPPGDFASCKRMCAGNQKSFRSSTIGFRCCADSPPR